MLMLTVSAIVSATAVVTTENYANCTNLAGRFQAPLPPPGESNSTASIYFLGQFDTQQSCLDEVLKRTTEKKYFSYTWFSEKVLDKPYSKMCYAVASHQWDWFPHNHIEGYCGKLFYGCSSDEDCALNGKCKSDKCECNPGWTGLACTRLNEQPTIKNNGFQYKSEGVSHSSWGGPIQKINNTYHMYSSLMTHKCGLASWATNSKIIHATSDSLLGPYQYDGTSELFPVFSHEPDVKPVDKSGKLGIFFTMRTPDTFPLCNCTNGTTPSTCTLFPAHPDTDPTYLSTATNPNGPWSSPIVVMENTTSDTNLSPLINDDGSLIGLWRSFFNHSYSRIHVVTASNYQDPSTYKYTESWDDDIFNLGGPTEDPFLFTDSNGYYHGIFHNMYGCMPCGGHAFSKDGKSWTYTGGDSYGWKYEAEGTRYEVVRRERPHLFFDENKVPIALSTGAIPGEDTHDYSFTLVVPIGL